MARPPWRDPLPRTYVRELVARLRQVLADDLAAVYLVGSLALGDYVPGRSDIDIVAVCEDRLTHRSKEVIVEELSHPRLECPTRGLEFVLYTRSSAATASRTPRFALNLNTGPRMPQRVSFDPASEPSHWFVLDIALARQRAVVLAGAPPVDLFGPVPEEWVLDALLESLEWHADHETMTHYSVLNACRSWRLAEEGVFDSKAGGAAWARGRADDPAIIDSALAIREGKADARLDREDVRSFVRKVRGRIVDVRDRQAPRDR